MITQLIVAIIIIFCLYWWMNSKPKGFPPGPPALPIIGSLPFLPRSYIHFTLEKWRNKYGSVVGGILPKVHMIFVSSYDAAQEVFHKDEFQGRPDTDFIKQRSFNKRLGVFFTDGPYWVEQRRFTLRHLRDLGFGKSSMDAIVHEEVDDFFETLQDKTELQISGTFNRSLLNVLWAIVAGVRFPRNDKKFQELQSRIFNFSRSTSTIGNLASLFPVLKIIARKVTGFADRIETLRLLQNSLKETIEEHKQSFDSELLRDFIDVYIKEINLQKNDSETNFTDESLIIICLDLFTAGAESVSNTLAFCIQYLILYPDIQKKVQKELDQVVGRDRKPCITDRPQMPYTEAFLAEVSRINPTAPMAPPHRALKDAKLMGYHIPKDSLLFVSQWSILHDKNHWGDPETFRPERFINSEGKFVKDDHLILFGAGKRLCIGERLANNTLFTFFTCLVQKYSFSLPPNEPKPSTRAQHGFTAAPQPFTVKLINRK